MRGFVDKYRKAYAAQERGAKRRGIAWEFSFEEWLSWWGDDIDRRGSREFQLQMQRNQDAGPYAAWNVRNGRPRQNVATATAMAQNRKSVKAAAEHQARLDAMMFAPSAPPDDDFYYADEEETANKYAARVQSNFPRTSQLIGIR